MPIQSYLCSTDEEFLSIDKYKPVEADFIMYMTGATQSRGDVNNIR